MEPYRFAFERLEAWQLARKLATAIYQQTGTFPPDEKFGLISQIRRAALSVCANLAEGSSRSTSKDQAHFTSIAFSSLLELLNHLIISNDLGYLSINELAILRRNIQNLSIKLNNLKTAQLKRSY